MDSGSSEWEHLSGCFKNGNEASGCQKMWGISWLAEELASQDSLYFMKLFYC
jgi:hypothetical protein